MLSCKLLSFVDILFYNLNFYKFPAMINEVFILWNLCTW